MPGIAWTNIRQSGIWRSTNSLYARQNPWGRKRTQLSRISPVNGFRFTQILQKAIELTFSRSTKQAFRKWADEVGDPSYTFDKLLPYFKRSVNFQPPNNDIRAANATPLYKDSAFSAKGGPLRVSYPNYANPYSSWAKLALKELGLKERQDFMSGGLLGYQYTAQSLDRDSQSRSSSETSFLRTALRTTTNLLVYKSTLAKKIIFNQEKRATGVLVNTGGVEYTLSARKEVIVSAGAVSLLSIKDYDI